LDEAAEMVPIAVGTVRRGHVWTSKQKMIDMVEN